MTERRESAHYRLVFGMHVPIKSTENDAHELARWHATSADWSAVATYLRGDVNAMNAVRLYGDARERRVRTGTLCIPLTPEGQIPEELKVRMAKASVDQMALLTGDPAWDELEPDEQRAVVDEYHFVLSALLPSEDERRP